eukprot:scaffold47216_cov19-Tisochrysis_lutea.AAC.2
MTLCGLFLLGCLAGSRWHPAHSGGAEEHSDEDRAAQQAAGHDSGRPEAHQPVRLVSGSSKCDGRRSHFFNVQKLANQAGGNRRTKFPWQPGLQLQASGSNFRQQLIFPYIQLFNQPSW